MNAGTVLGGASLAIQLTGVCLQGYKVAAASLEAAADSRVLGLQFGIERLRFEDFTRAVGLSGGQDEGPESVIHLTGAPLLVQVLDQIHTTLQRFAQSDSTVGDLPGGYGNPTISSIVDRASRPARALDCARSFRWSILKKEETEMVLQRLIRYNDFLHELLDARQLRRLQRQQRESLMDVVQVRNSLEDIRKLIEAAHIAKSQHSQSCTGQRQADAELENLASFKAMYACPPTNNSTNGSDGIIDCSHIELDPTEEAQCEHPRVACTFDSSDSRACWIDWQHRSIPDDDGPSASLSQLAELTKLLKTPKPDEFRILPCLGYSILQRPSKDQPQPALIFEFPAGADPTQQPYSLMNALELCPKPSLSRRIVLAQKIAQCVLYFHAVNWLHKAIRSSNIVFFHSSSTETDLDICNPYITGFGSSRPSRFGENTSEVPHVGRTEVYRHPDTQSAGVMLSYRKTFDIYSLGLVLVEVAMWQSIVRVMGIEKTVDKSPTVTLGVQDRWLLAESELLRRLEAEVGVKYANVVEMCLKGRDAFGIQRGDTETSADAGLFIQREFNARVIRVLGDIVV